MSSNLFECKGCTGELKIIANGIGRCLSCGEKPPIPKENAGLFNRANKLRFENKDFDVAGKLYEKIVREWPDEPEACWGLLLCRFGIKYVKDQDVALLPTCHRTLATSILDDADFRAALANAAGEARAYYEVQAALIDVHQKRNKQIAAQEEPCDVFIGFEATDAQGVPTADSLKALELYCHSTKQLSLKVFFSSDMLKDKIGEEYEPIIFAALTSAKVMVLIAGRSEHMSATSVKNEWRRYLRMLEEAAKAGHTKRIVAVLCGMKPEQLDSELDHLQAVDLNEFGALDKLRANINGFIGQEKAPAQALLTTAISAELTAEALAAKQARNALELGKQALEKASGSRPPRISPRPSRPTTPAARPAWAASSRTTSSRVSTTSTS